VLDLLGRDPLLRRPALAELGARRDAVRFGTVTVIELAVRGATDEPVAAHADTALCTALTGTRTAVDRRPPLRCAGRPATPTVTAW
jgi:hypothetical protein